MRLHAVVDIAATACGNTTMDTPVAELVEAVARAMANAVGEVTGSCEGLSDAQVTIEDTSRAEARAQAVGIASAGILATSEVCDLCTVELDTLVSSVETVAAEAEARLDVRPSTALVTGESYRLLMNCCSTRTESGPRQMLPSRLPVTLPAETRHALNAHDY